MIKMMDLQKNLNHPHIVKIIDFVREDFEPFTSEVNRKVTYAVQEFLDGKDLNNFVKICVYHEN